MGFFTDLILNKLHEGCHATERFYEERLERVRAARVGLEEQLQHYAQHVLMLSEKKLMMRREYEHMVRSRNKYRRKYVIHHQQAKHYAELAEACREMFSHPSLATADRARAALVPLCLHRNVTATQETLVSGFSICDTCGKKVRRYRRRPKP